LLSSSCKEGSSVRVRACCSLRLMKRITWEGSMRHAVSHAPFIVTKDNVLIAIGCEPCSVRDV
jgi:hypothetical protein